MSSHVAMCKARILWDTNNHLCTQESLTTGKIYFWEESTLLSQVLQLHAQQPVPCNVLLNCTEEGDQIHVRPVGKEDAAPAWPGRVTPWSQTVAAFVNGTAAVLGMAVVNKGTKFNFISEAVM